MQANCFIDSLFSDINNSISAPALGAGGRGFESRYPDEKGVTLSSSFFICEKILFQMKNICNLCRLCIYIMYLMIL